MPTFVQKGATFLRQTRMAIWKPVKKLYTTHLVEYLYTLNGPWYFNASRALRMLSHTTIRLR